jgi:PAS domain S-box-containing protein
MAARDANASMTERKQAVSYAIAAAGVVLAGTSGWWLSPILGDTPPMRLMLVVAVFAAAWRGGIGPGLVATVLGLVAIVAANDAPGDLQTLITRLIRFGSVALLISLCFGAVYRSWRQSELKEKEFHRSEGRYRRLVETAGEGIWVIDHGGRTTYANPRLGEMLGVPPEHLLGMSFKKFLVDPRDAAGHWWEPPSGVLSWHEISLRGFDGSVRHTIVTARPLGADEFSGDSEVAAAGDVRGFLLMVADVTPLKKTEQALREKESVLRSFYESSVMAMGVVELAGDDTRFVSANGLTDSFFGLEPGKLEGRTAQQIKAPPEMLATWNERFRECMATGRPVRFEYRGICASSPAWVAATLSPMMNSERALCSFIVEDITERKRTEEDLRKAKELAEAASHAKDRFLAVLSHELRTPLTPALIAVSSLVESKSFPSIMPTLEMIRRNIELEARLIDDLLDLSRIVRGRLRLEYEVVDVHQAIRRSMEICRDETLISGLHVLTELKAPQHHVSADHARVMQVIWNLIRNAAKFTPSGGRLTIRTSNFTAPAGDRTALGAASGLAVEFEDTGVGIEPTLLTRIFNPFEQGDEPLRGRAGGLGLGLAISRSLAEAMGGRLVASSPGRGQGSVFRLELAIVAAPLASRAGIASPRETLAVTTGPELRILMVEDNKDTLRYLSAILRQRGHLVTTADCVAAAFAAVEQAEAPFDLLLSDIELPDGTGHCLMRGLKVSHGLPGIAMSGFGALEDLRQSREAGFFDHLTKPIDVNRLDAAIRRATSADAGQPTELDDSVEPFTLRTDGADSGAFKIVWARESKSDSSR